MIPRSMRALLLSLGLIFVIAAAGAAGRGGGISVPGSAGGENSRIRKAAEKGMTV